jgi:uncharacterized protein YndB with AHSA1/START domain
MADFRIEAKDTTDLVVERQFAAKVETVVQAFLEPDMLKKWMGSAGMPLETAGIDPRPGGAFRYVWGLPDTDKVVLTGQFHVMDVAPNGDRAIVHSEIFEPDWTGGETLVRTDYTARMGGTLVRTVITYGTAAARDGAAASDMGDAMRAAYDRLDGLLAAG